MAGGHLGVFYLTAVNTAARNILPCDFWWGYGFLNRLIRARLMKKGVFKQRLEGSKGVNRGNLGEEQSCYEDTQEARVWLMGEKQGKPKQLERVMREQKTCSFFLGCPSSLSFLFSVSIVFCDLGAPVFSRGIWHQPPILTLDPRWSSTRKSEWSF